MCVCVFSDVLNYVKAKNLKPVTQSVDLPPAAQPVAKPTTPPARPVSAAKPAAAAALPFIAADFTDIEVTNMRSVIASRLTMSKVSLFVVFLYFIAVRKMNQFE